MDVNEPGVSLMEGPNRTLVALLTMHRSGSSLTANILQRLGMSLGPFELLGAEPTNPYGHFESIPFQRLNRRVQKWAFGFADDMPTSPEIHAHFLETQGAWPTDRTVPAEWLDEGESFTRTLVESGSPCGFKDPRTVLTWPFWQQVFQRIENLEVIPMVLLRSPHEIAMSLCSRTKGLYPYWDALDLTGVHLARLKAIADEREQGAPVARFGSPHYRADLQRLTATCGLTWDEGIVDQVYDHSCVHQLPAAVSHPAQELYNALCGEDWAELDSQANARRIAQDARRYEGLMHERQAEFRDLFERHQAALRHTETLVLEANQRAEHWQAMAERAEGLLNDARAELGQTRNAYELTRECLEQSERNLLQAMECLVSVQERRARVDGAPLPAWEPRAGSESALHELLRQFVQAQDQLDREQEETRRNLDAARAELHGARERIAELQGTIHQREEQLGRTLEREGQLGAEASLLRCRLDRIESHAVLGPALRGRRRVKRIWLKLRQHGRSARIDQPI